MFTLKKIGIAFLSITFMLVVGCAGNIDNSTHSSLDNAPVSGFSETLKLASNKVEGQVDGDAVLSENMSAEKREPTRCSSGSKQICKPIEKDGEDYSIRFDYDYIHDGVTQSSVNGSVTICVFDSDMKTVQEIEFESWCDWGEDAFHDINVNEWRVIDINFDGYQDIICLSGVGGAKGNHFYLGWLWNPSSSSFEITNIDNICNLSIHASDQSLRSVESESAGHHIYQIYRYIGDRFVLTNQLDIGKEWCVIDSNGEAMCNYVEGKYAYAEAPGERCSVSEMEVVDGVERDVFPQIICDTSVGTEIIYNRLYGDESIWFGKNSPDFFASAYGDCISGSRIDRD